MLEIRNVTKIYRSRTGEQVVALNNVSVAFPETGMVFILGKSGSGKSTLLNVIGGLDGYDSGEFVIMGKSSKDFVGSDFDAYRNTFIGFIFQEYNILDDFSVGANIGLALELQGKKATNEKITDILQQVDLLNFANRKPNELSGGQKQRIAIARALVKDPQIIMADEPTGALDSKTGKQIFDTLKELSKRKLVLIVSHDRDFAERYADRIIELADGNIISDVTKHERASVALSDGIQQMSDKILRIRPGYRLTAADLQMINDYLATNEEGVLLSADGRVNEELRSAAGITEDGSTAVFEETDAQRDVPVQQYDGKKTKFIRSRLPMKNAVKMGASGLKHKKFRLFMTILLSLIAFSMFGIADTMAAYNKASTATRSILDSNIDNASFSLSLKETYHNIYNGKESTSVSYRQTAMNDADLQTVSEKTGIPFISVFTGSEYSGYGSISLGKFMANYTGSIPAYTAQMTGFVALTQDQLAQTEMTVAGRLPQADDEIAIPKFLFDQLNLYGFRNNENGRNESVEAGRLTAEEGANGILGKHLYLRPNNSNTDTEYTVVGVVDTRFDSVRYKDYLTENGGNGGTDISDMLLQLELQDTLRYGFHTLCFVTAGAIEKMSATVYSYSYKEIGISTNDVSLRWDDDSDPNNSGTWFSRVASPEEIAGFTVTRLDGTTFTTLGEKEYLVSASTYFNLLNGKFMEAAATYPKTEAKYAALFSEAAREWAQSQGGQTSYYTLASYAAAYQAAEESFAGHEEEMAQQGYYSVGDYAWTVYYDRGETLAQNGRAQLAAALFEDYGLEFADIPEAAKGKAVDLLWDVYPPSAGYSIQLYNVRRVFACYYAAIDVYGSNSTLDVDDLLRNKYGWNDLNGYSDEEKKALAFDNLSSTLTYDSSTQKIGSCSPVELLTKSITVFSRLTGMQDTTQIPALRKSRWDSNSGQTLDMGAYDGYTLAGYFVEASNSGYSYESLIVSAPIKAEMLSLASSIYYSELAPHEPGFWSFAIAPMPRDKAAVQKLVELHYTEGGDLQFTLRNQVMNALDSFNSFIEVASKVFLYVGIGFAVFSALLLMNFISVSISYKRHEIGILRAVGARSSDVFKIFFSESFIIALINYVLAVAATITTIFFINRAFRQNGLTVTLLNFGVRQLALMFLITLGVAAIASFLPVWNIARRRPIDAIRNR